MSAAGMTRTVLATGLQQALAADAAAGKIGFTTAEYGPAVRAWLQEVAESLAAPTWTQPQLAPGEAVARVYENAANGEFSGHAHQLAAGLGASAPPPPWRAASEHDVTRLEFMPTRTPDGEKKVKWVTSEHVVEFTDGSSYPLAQVQVRGDLVVRLDELNWQAITAAASRSKWMPPQYVVNDWHADVCRWLEHGPFDEIRGWVDQLAQQWDGCMYDAPGGEIDIGQAIRDYWGRGVERAAQPEGSPAAQRERAR